MNAEYSTVRRYCLRIINRHVILGIIVLSATVITTLFLLRHPSDKATIIGPNGQSINLIPPLSIPDSPPAPTFAPSATGGPTEFDPYGKDGVIALNMGTLVAHVVIDGIVVHDVRDTDAKGAFTAIPNASDFHRLSNLDGSPSPYYQAGKTIYIFKYHNLTPETSSYSSNIAFPKPETLTGADSGTFVPGIVPSMHSLAKDAFHVYLNGIAHPEFDSSIAVIADRPLLFKDMTQVYESLGGDTYATLPFDSQTVNFLTPIGGQFDLESDGYVTDKNGAYFDKKKMPSADSSTLTVFTNPPLHGIKGSGPIYSYAKDSRYVYYAGQTVAGADPTTFVPVDNGGTYSYYYGRDARHLYEGTSTMPVIDPQTVQILWYPIYEGCSPSIYIKDARAVYYIDFSTHSYTSVQGADPATFKSLINDYGRDKNGIWLKTEFKPNLPKDFAPVCNYG